MFKLIERLKWLFTKRQDLKNISKSGCDVDGDIFSFKNKKYYVHSLARIVKEIKWIDYG